MVSYTWECRMVKVINDSYSFDKNHDLFAFTILFFKCNPTFKHKSIFIVVIITHLRMSNSFSQTAIYYWYIHIFFVFVKYSKIRLNCISQMQ